MNLLGSTKSKAIIAFILGIFIACTFVQQRTMIKQCEVSLRKIWITDISLTDITVRVKLRIKNNTDIDVIVDDIDAQLFLDETESGNVTFKRMSIKAHQAEIIPVFVRFTYKQLKNSIKDLIKKRGKIKYRFVGIANIQSPFGEMQYPFDFKYESGAEKDGGE
jgi:LEA14-like dessication related protein